MTQKEDQRFGEQRTEIVIPQSPDLICPEFSKMDTCLAQEPPGVVEYTLPWPEKKGDPFCFDLAEIQDLMKKPKSTRFA